MIDWVKRLFKTEPVQRTFCYCPNCNNELCGSKSYVGPDWKDKSIETYSCSKCAYFSRWHFDSPVPILISSNPPKRRGDDFQECAAPPALTKEMLKNYKPDPANFGEPWHHCACGAMFHLKDSPAGMCPNCRDAKLAHQETTK